MKINILPADTYTIINKTVLNSSDYQYLIMLYQPLIGSDAVSLYMTLWSYLDKEEISSDTWTHHHLMLSMRSKLGTIIEAKDRLEAIGLIKSYVKEAEVNNFIYELYSPLNCREFIENPILSTSLYNNVGKKEYDRITNYFTLPKFNLKEYKDVTNSFSEVFSVETFTPVEKLVDDIKKNNKRDLDLMNEVDINNVISNIPESLINHRSITKNDKDLINKLSITYNLKEETLNRIIINSLVDRKIDRELVRTNARNLYKFENSGHLPSIVFKNQPDFLRSSVNDTSKKSQLIHQFEVTSPYEFLSLKNGKTAPSKSDLLLLEELLVDLDLLPGVVNVLVDYVLRINNNKLTKAYVLAIASQWKRSNITTVIDAMSFAEKEQSKKKTTTGYKPKTSAKPVWIDQSLDADAASLEEQQAVEKLLKNFK